MKLLFKLATRSRPQKLFACIGNIIQQVNDKENYEILVTADEDDKSMNNPEVLSRCRQIKNDRVHLHFGKSENKIAAYNRDMELAENWDILINTSDDMLFTMPGFDDIIKQDMVDVFGGTDGFLHYNDGNQRDNICTLAIMGKRYYDRFGYIYHPSYQSLWCDNEQTEVAKILGRYKYMGDEKQIFKHHHPAWGYGGMDDLYMKNESRENWDRDKANFNLRKKINFGLC